MSYIKLDKETKNIFIRALRLYSYVALYYGSHRAGFDFIYKGSESYSFLHNLSIMLPWENFLFLIILPLSIMIFLHPIKNDAADKNIGSITKKRILTNFLVAVAIIIAGFFMGAIFGSLGGS